MNEVSSPCPAPLPTVRPRRRWVTWLLIVVVFASGMVVGGGGLAAFVRNRSIRAVHQPEIPASTLASWLQRRLALDDQQAARVREIIHRRLVAIRGDVARQLDGLQDDVGQALNASQREKWTALVAERRQLWLPVEKREAKDKAK